jgi:NAD(P)-dependent dehydrogenase (short-subunit alcohol dehydrogenase family)
MRLQRSSVAANAGVVNLTRSMALELAPHDPRQRHCAGFDRRIGDAKSAELDLHARLMSHIPFGRPATTQDIADEALFLAAPIHSEWIVERPRTPGMIALGTPRRELRCVGPGR